MTRLNNNSKAAVIYEKGTPDVFKWEEFEVPNPKNKDEQQTNLSQHLLWDAG